MTTLPKELSPERCHQLREQGFLRVLVNLLQEHTFELQNKPEADFNIESFLMDFNRKSELRSRLSQQLRTIVEHTAKSEDELNILGMLETPRKYTEKIYNCIVDLKAMTKDPSKLSECIDQLTKFAGQVKKVIKKVSKRLKDLDSKTRPIFEQFGGVFVIVDYLRAQTRFNAKCRQLESAQIDTSLLRVAKDSKLVLRDAVTILYKLLFPINSNNGILLFLGNSRSLQEIMVDVVEDAYDNGDLPFVQVYCRLLHILYYTHKPIVPTIVMPSTSHLKDCGVIQCLAKFGMETKDPETLYYVIMALDAPLALDRQNVLEFVSIDGAVDMLIDVLVPSKEKDEDVENAKWYEKQRLFSTNALVFIGRRLMHNFRLNGRLLAIFESRDFASILIRQLEQITSIHEPSPTTRAFLSMLKDIFVFSNDQRRKFTEIANGKEVVKSFESSDDEHLARLSKQIGKMFE